MTEFIDYNQLSEIAETFDNLLSTTAVIIIS